ncbi:MULTISPECIES: flavodoxin [Helicobacter]|uniref:Flavodoxin n=1 Tax=Helicobacter ibis TaxID=2962633 RepID=A0ABT4VDW9_9HELI|nr:MULTISPECIES: flavodoxin [Helicobacter]MDA3966505.1 flavodoxin [Helicobacter sp. WB40]MDA3968879.1 flavodoxin [Helicobacter ibis]
MKKIGLFYGSDGGTTENVANKIASILNNVDIYDVSKSSKEELLGYDNLILATPTYGSGDLQGDWEDFVENFSAIDFKGKTIALVGLGDQDVYSDTFCDGIFSLYELVKESNMIGQTSIEGYEYEASKAEVDGKFVGLVIDDVNQDDLTDSRISKWVSEIKDKFN